MLAGLALLALDDGALVVGVGVGVGVGVAAGVDDGAGLINVDLAASDFGSSFFVKLPMMLNTTSSATAPPTIHGHRLRRAATTGLVVSVQASPSQNRSVPASSLAGYQPGGIGFDISAPQTI